MNKTKRDKPLVSILMAVYKPNKTWLIEQLDSLNKQSYENLELYIYDDCPESKVDEDIFKKYITNFKYKIVRGTVNKGSNIAFESLTKIAEGKYFVYCDQDDIWEKEKIEILVNTIEKEESVLVYSDMSVIDEKSNFKYSTLLEAKPRIKYIYGDKCYKKLFFKNCISGCCMLVKSEIAKSSVPFSKTMVHDQWIATVAGAYGKISFINRPLVKYRIHSNNQTGSLKGIDIIEDYYNVKVNILDERLENFKTIILNSKKDIDINEIKDLCLARINRKIFKIFKYRNLCRNEAYFEIIIKVLPEGAINYIIKKLKS